MCESLEGMQHMLNILSEYYTSWKVHVNDEKTKVAIFFPLNVGIEKKYIYK